MNAKQRVRHTFGLILAFFSALSCLGSVMALVAFIAGSGEEVTATGAPFSISGVFTFLILIVLFGALCWLGIKTAWNASSASPAKSDGVVLAGPRAETDDSHRSSDVSQSNLAREKSRAKSSHHRRKSAYPKLMSGQLVARYKQTHEMSYRVEYLERLMHVGLSETEAEVLFMFELMILKHDAIERLASDDYIGNWVFGLEHVALPLGKDYYIDHQSFLVSEIVKIWDEAEWHYFNSHERDLPDDVWGEIYTISRYGGGELFVEYLQMLSEKSSVPMDKVQAYSAAEQNMLFAYKWNSGKELNPYES